MLFLIFFSADLNGGNDRISLGHSGRKHLLVISDVDDAADRGRYTCHAINELGESKGNIQVMGMYSMSKI